MNVTGRPPLNIARRWNGNISPKPATCGYDGSSSTTGARTTSHVVPDSQAAGGKLFRVGRSAREFGGAGECVPLSPIYHRCRDKGHRPRAAIPPEPRLGNSTCYPQPTFFPAIRASTFHISDLLTKSFQWVVVTNEQKKLFMNKLIRLTRLIDKCVQI
jgi:hypothetical protein